MKALAIVLPLVLLPFACSFAQAQDRTAPLPAGIAPSKEAMVQGLYAEAGFGRIDVRDDLEALETECKTRGVDARVEGRDLLWKGKHAIYRSHANVAVFEDTPTIKVDRQACSAKITLSRSVTAKSGPWSEIRTSEWINQHPPCSRFSRCWTRIIASVNTQCTDLGDGLVGSTICYSLQEDLSKDLIVARSSYTDDGSGPDTQWALDLVLTDVLIDPVVFAKAPTR
ncbi:hypothetical protein [Sphingomonas alpina]|uniref:Uncharacterized protein n=1 Tax=Sphingomonas alpina TaxID=653931 RepID=A0A7H0LLM2_9SPHN|nr:hypothetical protein [Sphingomonas alpina]QNQ10575.1 hypothetical protein H3Z74_05045 [Sphingomonas alpina]